MDNQELKDELKRTREALKNTIVAVSTFHPFNKSKKAKSRFLSDVNNILVEYKIPKLDF